MCCTASGSGSRCLGCFEVAPPALAQKFVRKWIDKGRPGRCFTPRWAAVRPSRLGPWVSAEHELEALGVALEGERRPFDIKVRTVNPGTYLTGVTETMTETAFRWLDDSPDFCKRAGVQAGFDALIGFSDGRLDRPEMIDAMTEVASNDSPTIRDVVSKAVEEMLKESQAAASTHTV